LGNVNKASTKFSKNRLIVSRTALNWSYDRLALYIKFDYYYYHCNCCCWWCYY